MPCRACCRAPAAIAVAAMALLLPVPGAAAKAPASCKPGKALVTVNRHATCRPLKSVLPPLAAREEVRAALTSALTFVPRSKGRKRPKTIARVLGKRRANGVRRRLLNALPALLGRLPSAHPARVPGHAAALDPCGDQAPDFQAKRGGIGLGLDKGQATLTADLGRLDVEVSFPSTIASCDRFKTPPCPTAAGVVDGHDDRAPEIRIVIADHGTVLYSATFRDTGHTELHGQVGADAKLDQLVISDTLRHVTRLGGSAHGFNYTEDGTVERTLTVDMRTGAQTTNKAEARMVARLDGRSAGAGFDENAGYELLVKAGPEFVALVDKATRRYRALETGWNADNACAAIDLSPTSGTLELHRNDRGQAAATIHATGGGTVADAIASITGEAGGTFAPQRARGGTPGFGYTVTADAGQLTLSIRATSTAGVASTAWSQPIVKSEWPVKQIAGTFSGFDNHRGTVRTWSGSARWVRAPNLDEENTDRVFTLAGGAYTATVSGTAGDCQISGQKQFTIPASPSQPSIRVFNPAADVVFGAGKADWQLPWDYFWSTPSTSDFTVDVTLSNCGDPAEDGTSHMGVPPPLGGLPGTTADGFSFAGTFEYPDPDPGDSGEDTWSFAGTPTS